jgi:hypothetical protein
MKTLVWLAVLSLSLTPSTFAQVQASLSDPQALDLAAKALAVLSGNVPINDVTLTANVVSIAGSDVQKGTATMMAKGIGLSRIDLSLSNGTQTNVRNDDPSGFPQGASAVAGSQSKPLALHNCWTSPGWFSPALLLAALTDSRRVLSYVGQEILNGTLVHHLRSYRDVQKGTPGFVALTKQLSTMDLYLDAATLFPVELAFNTHPDEDALTDIAIQVVYSSYQPLPGGGVVPMHIQRLIFGGLNLDVVVTSASFNSGIPDSLFTAQ